MWLTFIQSKVAANSENEKWFNEFCNENHDIITERLEHEARSGKHFHVMLKREIKAVTIPKGWDGMIAVSLSES